MKNDTTNDELHDSVTLGRAGETLDEDWQGDHPFKYFVITRLVPKSARACRVPTRFRSGLCPRSYNAGWHGFGSTFAPQVTFPAVPFPCPVAAVLDVRVVPEWALVSRCRLRYCEHVGHLTDAHRATLAPGGGFSRLARSDSQPFGGRTLLPCFALEFDTFGRAPGGLLCALSIPFPLFPFLPPLLHSQFRGVEQLQLASFALQRPASLARQHGLSAGNFLDPESAAAITNQCIQCLLNFPTGRALDQHPRAAGVEVALEDFAVLGQLAHGEIAADFVAALVLGEVATAAFIDARRVVPSRSAGPELYDKFMPPAVLGSFAAYLGHPAVKLTSALLMLTPSFGSSTLLVVGHCRTPWPRVALSVV
ncbi:MULTISPECIES: hypothetical protein [Nocardia]|uniref:hypothetical protein n=1 Tax=Nocardia TaxID=1817 RepID=UPI001894EC80|nr:MULTISPECIES: hypothetical protein [Nocardia]MBF6351998.1 hypothetical protein [Nocardia flavorosea]